MLDILLKRKSIRKYKNAHIEKKIDALIKGALLSPSSRALYPLEFFLLMIKIS